MYSIAIDGPAGSGKSTVAKIVAQKLRENGFETRYVDTGAIYRAVAYYLLNEIAKEKLGDENLIAEKLKTIDIKVFYEGSEQKVSIKGIDISEKIRSSEISSLTSKIATYKCVRVALINIQRDLSKRYNVVMDGRDIGTEILPKADLKIFLSASTKVRAKRRYKEQLDRGEDVNLEDIEKEIKERDIRDMTRTIAPLRIASDAIEIDTSSLTIDEVVEEILSKCNYE